MSNTKIPKVLIIAGSDSSGGAGIQADIKTLTAQKVYAMTAITTVTAQNTQGVSNVEDLSLEIIEQQIEACLSDIGIDAIKIGMVNRAEIFDIIFYLLKRYDLHQNNISIVVDPVMYAKGGYPLLKKNAIDALKDFIIKTNCLITPNIPEAEILSEMKIKSKKDMVIASKKIIDLGVTNILLKGGHLTHKILVDILNFENQLYEFSTNKINTKNTHGTGCTMSTAITGNLSKSMSMYEAVKNAHEFVQKAILNAPDFGLGHGPLNHFQFS